MNILLTDIRSLTLEMQGIPVVEQSLGDNFQHVLQQQLPTDAEQGGQAIEFKDFFINSLVEGETLEVAGDKAPLATWRDYLSQQQIRVTTDADPVETVAADLEAVLAMPLKSLSTEPVENAALPGEALPVSGKILPDEIIVDTKAAPRDDAAAVPRLDTVATVAAPATVNSVDELPAARLTPSAQSVRSIVGAADVTPASLTQTPQPSASVQAVPPGFADDRSSARLASAIASDIAADGEVELRVNQPLVNPRAIDIRAENPRQPSAVTAPLEPSVEPQPVLPGAAREIITQSPLPRESSAAFVASAREFQANSAKTPPLQAAAVVESVVVDPTLNAGRVPTEQLKAQVEAGVAEFSTSRSPEMSQQISQNQAQVAVTAMSAPTQAVASAPQAMPAVTPNPLPPQLETMSLARGAEATEWGNGLGDRVSWMINQKQNSATIRLDPPMLGKLDVQVRIADDATTITIQTQHAQTRELVESASVRLRDFLQESGYQNVNVDVSQRQDQQQARAQSGAGEQIDSAEDPAAEQESVLAQDQQSRYFSGDGIVDTFA